MLKYFLNNFLLFLRQNDVAYFRRWSRSRETNERTLYRLCWPDCRRKETGRKLAENFRTKVIVCDQGWVWVSVFDQGTGRSRRRRKNDSGAASRLQRLKDWSYGCWPIESWSPEIFAWGFQSQVAATDRRIDHWDKRVWDWQTKSGTSGRKRKYGFLLRSRFQWHSEPGIDRIWRHSCRLQAQRLRKWDQKFDAAVEFVRNPHPWHNRRRHWWTKSRTKTFPTRSEEILSTYFSSRDK